MLDGAPNYVEMVVSEAGSPDRYVVRVQRAEGRTPHELRTEAETRARRAERERDAARALSDRRWLAYQSVRRRATERTAALQVADGDVRHWATEAIDARRIMERRGALVKELKPRVAELEREAEQLHRQLAAATRFEFLGADGHTVVAERATEGARARWWVMGWGVSELHENGPAARAQAQRKAEQAGDKA
ncbi:hypothetical protein [Nocardiopsis synnemataformans]|uniref:hypothetical protein n=1 Tax=Nocardiopsis synnemataformans TaxID=61305 RepID=UPI003EBF6B64